MEITDSRVRVPGGSLFVRRWHTLHPAHPPIILLHDSLGSVEQWRDFPGALALAAGRDVVAYDRLGFGRSSPRAARPSFEFIEEEARSYFPAVRQVLDSAQVTLFGHSVGGAMALVIAATSPDGCDAVITESAQAFVEARTLSGIRSARGEFAEPAQFNKLTRWHGDKAQWVLDAWAEVWLSSEFSNWSLDAHLSRVRCPVLAIHGDQDEFGSVEFPRRITNGVAGPSELVILEHCGHVPHREQKDEVLRLAAGFLDRSTKASTRVTTSVSPD
jgi:pimeloyl-ACP methyl ester carboxylesterase